ncbi:MAG TPA: hypothetical protein DCZ95_12775 [Verrucomicrobia bacterium]|nr:MAG: hypothetical protein A2X46_11885 [Lentisphaerae bacterium GWF2_57_35]HBA84961.1 hypothetical protein [Verrucomicrobiota bacterium]
MQNYEKLILVVVLVLLMGSALFLLLQIGQGQKSLDEAQWEQPQGTLKSVPPLDTKVYAGLQASLDHPFQSSQTVSRLMVSELRVSCISCGKPIPYSAAKCSFCAAAQPIMINTQDIDSDGDGMSDVFEKSKGLNAMSHEDAALDADGDGFTNFEEFLAGTDLNSATSSPPPTAKLRLIRVVSNPFKLRFQGVQKLADGNRYQLNLRTLERTFFARLGDQIEGFEVVEYVPETTEGPTLILRQGTTTIRLVKGRAITQHEMVADMALLIDRSRLRQKLGDVFQVKDVDYKVIDILRDRVLIRNVTTGKNTSVGLLSEGELELLRGSGSAVGDGQPGG